MEGPSDDDTKKMIEEPLLHNDRKGGFRTLPFIIANEAFEKVASQGLIPNMILYLTRDYGMEAAQAAKVIFLWSAATYFTPVLGAFLADSYVGRFWMIGFGSFASLLGMVLLWSTTMIPHARPTPCVQFSDSCSSAAKLQLLLLYFSLALMSIGAGGIRSASLAFGADQLSEDRPQNARLLESFFNWYYVIVSVSIIVAVTCVVYIQDTMGWKVGFGVPVVLMTLSVVSFFLASPLYIKSKPKASFFTELAQVLLASYNNRSIQLSSQTMNEMYHCKQGSKLLAPSEKLRFLNKACIIKSPQEDLTSDGRASDPWRLCTVDQVEELKSIIKVIPIWSAGMVMAVTYCHSSLVVLQLKTMDRHITPRFEMPAGSFGSFFIFTIVVWVALYDCIIIPLASKLKGKPAHLRLKQKMGIGILFSSASTAAFAILGSVRRETAIKAGISDDPNSVVPISAFWSLPYQIFGGLAEAFNGIGQNHFYYTELPKSMSSIAANLYGMGMSAGNLVASIIMTTVDNFSKRGGNESWVSSNLNKGHLDYYYWLLTSLNIANFIYYLACSKGYGPCKGEGNEEEEVTDE